MGEQIRSEKAQMHRRSYPAGIVPNQQAIQDTGSPILIVIGSVDVQKDRLFVDIKGYAADGSTWTLDFLDLPGATEDFGGPWDDLAHFLENKEYLSDDGKKYLVAFMIIDSGHYTSWVYDFCARFLPNVAPCKGDEHLKSGETYKLFDKASLDRINLSLAYHINTTKLKDRIARSLNHLDWDTGEHQPWWYPNFPEDFRDDYFRMFEAENKMDQFDRTTNQFLRTRWVARQGVPNHAFDTYVYNLAALEIFADRVCREVLGLAGLDWLTFWQYARDTGAFYAELGQK
jgi:phage terminase large subunit GpA-like protein